LKPDPKIPVIFCLDGEPDPRKTTPGNPIPWVGFERAVPFFEDLRSRLTALSGRPARYSWFFRLDPQIKDTYGTAQWPLEQYAAAIEEFLAAGDEIGVHPHAFKWNEADKAWTGHYGDQEWVDYCVRMCFEAYEDFFGKTCRLIRFGDRWLNNESLRFAEKMGAQYDLTPEPGYPRQPASLMMKIVGEKFTDDLPDFRTVPHEPYRPSAADFSVADPVKTDGLWIIPLTTGMISPKGGRLERLYARMFRPAHLRPWNATLNLNQRPDHFRIMLYQWLETARYLAPVMRSDIFTVRAHAENLKANLETLLSHPKAADFVFTTPQEAMCALGYKNRRKVPRGGERAYA